MISQKTECCAGIVGQPDIEKWRDWNELLKVKIRFYGKFADLIDDDDKDSEKEVRSERAVFLHNFLEDNVALSRLKLVIMKFNYVALRNVIKDLDARSHVHPDTSITSSVYQPKKLG